MSLVNDRNGILHPPPSLAPIDGTSIIYSYHSFVYCNIATSCVVMNKLVCAVFLLLSVARMGTNAQEDTTSTAPPTVESTNTTTTNTTNNTTPTLNACDTIEAGDVYFTYVQANTPNEVVLFTFEDIPGDIKLYLTDNAWTGTSFQVDEGTLEVRGSLLGCIDWKLSISSSLLFVPLYRYLTRRNVHSPSHCEMLVVDTTNRRHCPRNQLWIRTIRKFRPGLGFPRRR